ncbi:MAG: hypothetical protein PHO66_07710 [Eubacteriales bacterium]|nr:hypothetical protein [Eubacteriales bacterium]
MALTKCPKCELNYMKEGQKMCSVCAQNSKSSAYIDDVDMCPNCGERESLPGEEFCAVCLGEFKKLAKENASSKDSADATVVSDDDSEASADEITEMDDVDLDTDDEPPFDIEEEMNDEAEVEESYDVLVMEEEAYDEDEAEE